MRALVIGGTGAVGREVVAALRGRGHEAVPSGRSIAEGEGLRLDLSSVGGCDRLAAVAGDFDVVVNTTGMDDLRLVAAIGQVPYVDITASSAYLDALLRRGGSATVVAGAGIAPGATTLLAAALDPQPGDSIDVAVLLSTGETHGPAAVAWTADLAGAQIHRAPEGVAVLNYRERRRITVAGRTTTHLRTDFPDHILLAKTGANVRSYLTLGSGLANAGLALVGAVPALRGLLAAAPHWGGDAWQVAALNRETGEVRYVGGNGQSRATGEIAALAAIEAARRPDLGVISLAGLERVSLLEAAISVTRSGIERARVGARSVIFRNSAL